MSEIAVHITDPQEAVLYFDFIGEELQVHLKNWTHRGRPYRGYINYTKSTVGEEYRVSSSKLYSYYRSPYYKVPSSIRYSIADAIKPIVNKWVQQNNLVVLKQTLEAATAKAEKIKVRIKGYEDDATATKTKLTETLQNIEEIKASISLHPSLLEDPDDKEF